MNDYDIEIVWVGSGGHLRRYKVVDGDGRYVSGGLFKTEREAIEFIGKQADPACASDVTIYGAGSQ